MAKTVKCEFCGKELVAKFFGGEDYCFSLGWSGFSFTCCETCNQKLEAALPEKDRKRLAIKMKNKSNVKEMRKNYTQEDQKNDVLTYIKEMQEYRNARGDERPGNLYAIEGERFWVEDSIAGFIAGKSAVEKELIRINNNVMGITDSTYFTKDDVTRIEYTVARTDGEPPERIFIFDIRLNDDKIITYRPTIVKGIHSVTALGFWQKKAIKEFGEELEEYRDQIGSDLPVVYLKKF